MNYDKARSYQEAGKLHEYIYHLVQGEKDSGRRRELIEEYAAGFGLGESGREKLDGLLSDLDTRRARKRSPVAWRHEPATDNQIRYLKRLQGGPVDGPITKGEASDRIQRLRQEPGGPGRA